MESTASYTEFIHRKSQLDNTDGFEPLWMPEFLFDFQRHLVEWAIRKGRSAIFADCGLGKTPMQLVWAENVVRHTNRPVLLVTPIAVGQQTLSESAKFGIHAKRTRDGVMDDMACIWVTNYEQLHKYDPSRFGGAVCDESSAIKDAKTERKKTVVEFMRMLPYRLLCTATAAPNDVWELGTSSEALGYLGFRDMITQFFKQEMSKDHLGWGRTKYRFRGHAEQPFWSWVCSWARSLRKPSDLGYDDARFQLPELKETEFVVDTAKPRPGLLFTLPAMNMRDERSERRHSITERCEKAAEIANAVTGPCVLWCELNDEADRLESMIGGVQVSGSMSDDAKEEALIGFGLGQIKRLITKPSVTCWGLNWQHCADTVVFPSHSYERYYQLVRRFYRFGQERPVNVSLIVCEGERGIIKNLQRKQAQASEMFDSIVRHMFDSMALSSVDSFPEMEVIPSWL